jgi:hypothetical protein
MREFVVRVRDEHGINLPFWQVRVVWVSENNLNIILLAQ